MKISFVKYVLVLCFTVALIFKVANVLSYLNYSAIDMENVSSNDDATEKEDKKVETEYFTQDFFSIAAFAFSTETPKKLILPTYFNKLSYFPEVLTPPPLV